MNNSDFQRLLLTNDKELVSTLTKPQKKKSAGKAREARGSDRPGKGKGKKGVEFKGEKGDGKGVKPSGGQAPTGPQYRDRAKERREEKGEYETVAQEFESHAEVSVDQSKYLGGDMDHTHLVKGLDFALLSKVRTELTKQQKAEELQEQRAKRKAGKQEKKAFVSELGKRVWHSVIETLHPHHSGFGKRLQNVGKALALGQRIRGAPSVFLPGRMFYEFDTGMSSGSSDIPRTVFASKEDAPSVDKSRWVAPILPETVRHVREILQRALEQKKQRKRERAAGGSTQATYAAQKVITKHKAKDEETDIFSGVGAFDPGEVARSVKSVSEAPSRRSSRGAREERRASYFDDAGAEKYKQAPEGQLDLAEVEVDEHDGVKQEEGVEDNVAFDAAERFLGPRPGWVFKTGPQGLGYYCEGSKSASAKSHSKADEKVTRKRRKAPGAPGSDDDAYGECFPSAGLGNAMVTTGIGLDDQEEEEVKKGSKLGAKVAQKPRQRGGKKKKGSDASS